MTTSQHAEVNLAPRAEVDVDWVDAHGDFLFHFALGQVRDAGVAEELVQETYLAALKARDRFAGQSSERTWLAGILRHKIYDHLRRICRERAIRVQPLAAPDDQGAWDEAVRWAHEVADECASPSRRLELDEFREGLETALGRLPARLAQVFQLYEIEQRSNQDVCGRLNISENNLWVMLHRARKQLREHLAMWWHGNANPMRQHSAML